MNLSVNRRGNCKKINLGLPCEIGLRTRTYHVLSGSVLSVWNIVETVLGSLPSTMQTKMQIIRLRTDDNQRIVGKWAHVILNFIPPDNNSGHVVS